MKKLILIALVMFAVNGMAQTEKINAEYINNHPISDTVSAILLVSDTSTVILKVSDLKWGLVYGEHDEKINSNIHSYYIRGYIVTQRVRLGVYSDYPENEFKQPEIIYLDANKKRITNLIMWDFRTY